MTTRKFDPGVLTGEQLEGTAKGIQWAVAGTFALISLIGTFVQFAGGWEYIDNFNQDWAWALIWSLVFQFFCSAGQFAFLRVRAWFWYIGCLGVSVIPSILSYWEYTGDYFAQRLPTPLAFILVVIACIALDCVPERILVKRK